MKLTISIELAAVKPGADRKPSLHSAPVLAKIHPIRMQDYTSRDRAIWEGIFADMAPEWYDAPPSDAMLQCRAYFLANPCRRLLDVGCGFGRWARFLAGHGATEVIGIDNAVGGIRNARGWAERSGFNARFLVASATALPFRARLFDGVLAALILDGLSRADCLRAVQGVNEVVQMGGRGFFVFNPLLTPSELAAISDENPTKGCMHVAYADDELISCLTGWSITRSGGSAEGFRLLEATRRA